MGFFALSICVCFIAVSLWLDWKRNPSISTAAILPFIWLTLLFSRTVSRWLSIAKRASVDDVADIVQEGNIEDRIVFGILILIGIFIILNRKKMLERLSYILGENKVWLSVFAYCVLSIIWSDEPYVSVKRLLRDFGSILMVLVIITETSPFYALRTILRRCIFLLAPLSIVFCKYYPDIGRYQVRAGDILYQGVTINKNSLGVICLVGGIVIFVEIWRIWNNKKKDFDKTLFWLYSMHFVVVLYLLKFADSMTSVICLILGLVIFMMPFLQKNLVKILIALALIYPTGLIDFIYYDIGGSVFKFIGRQETLTGRSDLWVFLLNMKTDPYLGTGYDSFWLGERIIEIWNAFQFGPKQAHNGYLEVYLNLGIFGLCILALAVYLSYRKIRESASIESAYHAFRVSFFGLFLLYNMTEATFFSVSPLWPVFLFICLWNGDNFSWRNEHEKFQVSNAK